MSVLLALSPSHKHLLKIGQPLAWLLLSLLRNQRWTGPCGVSAFATMYQVLVRIWETPAISTELPSDDLTPEARQAGYEFVEKAFHLESLEY